MIDLAAYQDAFAAALLADVPVERASPEIAHLVRQPGFAVYRNTVMKGCIDALQANYPTVERLVGEEWFRAAAAVFARTRLPAQPSLLSYGDGLPTFLESFGPAREVPYLAAVARVDRWWTEAHAAADAPLLDAAQLAALAPDAMASRVLTVHPAARWGWSDDWPIYRLWVRNREGGAAGDVLVDWTGEGVLVTRAVGPVAVEALGRGGVALLDACAAGSSIDVAVGKALEAQADSDIAALICQFLRAGAFSGVRTIAKEEVHELATN
ncbi:MAG: HvfC/BufC family peptide modification chaperone [Burkholderiaceae bacterium]